MKKLMILTLALATALPVFAQTPSDPPRTADRAQHEVKRLTTLLSLTAAQQQQATTIFANSEKVEQSLRENDKTAHENLRTAIKNNDAAAIDQIAGTMAQSVAQRISAKAKADAAFYQLLTPEQQTKMSDLQAEHL